MGGQSCYVFLTGGEFRSWLDEVCEREDYEFWPELGSLNAMAPALERSDVARQFNGSRASSSRILVGRVGNAPIEQRINMSDGSGWKISRNPAYNPEFISLLPGYEIPEKKLVSTMVSSTGDSAEATQIFARWKQSAKKRTKFITGYYVSKLVLDQHAHGVQLATHAGEQVLLAADKEQNFDRKRN